MKVLIIDSETTGLDWTVPGFKVHCVCTYDVQSGTEKVFLFNQVSESIDYINTFDLVVGHNIQFFDLPLLEYVTKKNITTKPFDTKILAGMIFPTVEGGHSLGKWGERLGLLKTTEFTYTDFSTCTSEMIEQCKRDVQITYKLYRHLISQNFSQEAIDLETIVATAIQKQVARGIRFDEDLAKELYLTLSSIRDEVYKELKETFPRILKIEKEQTPKRDNQRLGYLEGASFCKITLNDFNPESNDHIIKVLMDKGWRPTEFTPTEKPKVDETVLSGLPYPEAQLLVKASLINKRIAMLAEGEQAWLKLVKNGRIHSRVFTTGTITGRMSSGQPNLQQVTSVGKLYGEECRSLFVPDEGKVLVGCDAASLELRCLAHYLSRYDGGQFAKIVCEGDIHQFNANILEVPRDLAKKFIYAFLYGAGPKKIGMILGISFNEAKAIINKFLRGLPALARLKDDIQRAAKKGYLLGLDKRKLYVRSEHAALNTLLQGAGAILMKKAISLAYLRNPSLELLLTVHDEVQLQGTKEEVDNLGKFMVKCIQDSGKALGLRCPLDAEYKIGANWAESH